MPGDSEVAILSRVIEPDRPLLSAEVARLIVQWDFSQADRLRMHELVEKAKAGTLTAAEKEAAENYERVGHLLSMLKAKARVSIRTPPATSS